ncbi:hypothetical protein SLEP1_g44815 [Rubroshorea leprosula]|uniref:Uncharacterized protein n=1 Tax=Rubroshorea leprosula TaxID=152421 RepID=A0AAV5LHG9_9ROSI|nr:hypothetical protein SLEP1_g44815 [Rubroshorea leprosula]
MACKLSATINISTSKFLSQLNAKVKSKSFSMKAENLKGKTFCPVASAWLVLSLKTSPRRTVSCP